MPTVNSEILIWARESSGLDLEQAAKKLNFSTSNKSTAAEKLLAFEQGKNPSRNLLLKMSRLYRKPLLTFYLSNKPKVVDRGEDFRTLPDSFNPIDDANVNVLIRNIRARQSIVKELLIDEDEAIELSFIGSIEASTAIKTVSNSIQKTLGFDLPTFRKYRKNEDAFRYLRTLVENSGIFVVLAGNLGSYHSNIALNIFRGYALADNVAPFIVLNDQDAKSAWSFTLLHEAVHLWLGQTGISNTYAENKLEKFCNDVASEILLPESEFNSFQPSFEGIEELALEIGKYATQLNISSSHIAYRLFLKGVVNKAEWEWLKEHFYQKWLLFKKEIQKKNKSSDSAPNPYIVKKSKLGPSLIGLAKRMTDSGALTPTKASLLLGVRPINVQKFFDTVKAA